MGYSATGIRWITRTGTGSSSSTGVKSSVNESSSKGQVAFRAVRAQHRQRIALQQRGGDGDFHFARGMGQFAAVLKAYAHDGLAVCKFAHAQDDLTAGQASEQLSLLIWQRKLIETTLAENIRSNSRLRSTSLAEAR